jgi:2-polyprenyl-3-methyl-5-hydroxy-6-metoxy-1,4-benzoquinol methylase
MANVRNKEIDGTHLDVEKALERGIVHRDYFAHCVRWSNVLRHLHISNAYKTARILDTGCGKAMPLACALYTNKMGLMEGKYLGLDYNKLELNHIFTMQPSWLDFKGGVDASSPAALKLMQDFKPNYIVSFEMLEHMEFEKQIRVLENWYQASDEKTDLFISTPAYNGKDAAGNHVCELSFVMLKTMFEYVGFNVVETIGTFASQSDYKDSLATSEYGDLTKVFDRICHCFDSNLVSNIMAALVPAEQSRNAFWHLKKGTPSTSYRQKLLDLAANPINASSTVFNKQMQAYLNT